MIQDDDSDAEDDLESLGDEAIDLATALDQAEEESEEEEGEEGSEGSSEDGEDGTSGSESEEEDDDDDEMQDEDALKGLVADFAGAEDGDGNKSSRQKIDLKDLALTGVKDANMRKSLKLMNKEEKETRPGASRKLDVPLAQRQQDRILRKAAYEKTNETLNRWTDTIKQNRRAEHLVFPLPQNLPNAVLNNPEMQPLKPANATSELEQTMFSLLEQSGLGLEKEPKKPKDLTEEEHKQLSKTAQKELLAQRRLEREAQSREAKRAARLKKIKSKAYHRVHRKQKQKDEMATREAMEEAGEIDSEEEREAQDRARALERVGARHKSSNWAKMGSKVKRAVWDDDYRAGLTDMARRDEELRKRVEGKDGEDSDEESSESGSESEDEREKLERQLEKAAAVNEDEPKSGLMQLKFMKREEERQKKANDELAAQIRRDLNSDNEESEDDEAEVGRKKYGMGNADALVAEKKPEKTKRHKGDVKDQEKAAESTQNGTTDSGLTAGPRYVVQSDSIGGAWSKGGESRRKSRKSAPSRAEPLDLNSSILVADVAKSRPKVAAKEEAGGSDDADSDEGVDLDLPLAIRDEELIARAFAGDDVVAQFEQEKEELVEEQDDKVVDNTLPGWGSWTGEGMAGRKGRYLTKVEGVKKKDRQDTKLDKVIVNEKRVKKVCNPPSLFPKSAFLLIVPTNQSSSQKKGLILTKSRTKNTSPRSSRTSSSQRSSTRGPSDFPWARTSSPRRHSRMARSRGSSSSRVSLRQCRGLPPRLLRSITLGACIPPGRSVVGNLGGVNDMEINALEKEYLMNLRSILTTLSQHFTFTCLPILNPLKPFRFPYVTISCPEPPVLHPRTVSRPQARTITLLAG